MKITASSVVMNSQSSYAASLKKDYSATVNTKNVDINTGKVTQGATDSIAERTRELTRENKVSVLDGYVPPQNNSSKSAQDMQNPQENAPPKQNTQDFADKYNVKFPNFAQTDEAAAIPVRSVDELKLRLIEMFVEAMKQAKSAFRFMNKVDSMRLDRTIREMGKLGSFGQGQQISFAGGGNSQRGGVMQFTQTEEVFTQEIRESQKMSFNASVNVKTASGESISIDIEANVSREFYQKTQQVQVGAYVQKLVDPLVINFDTASAGLSDSKFSFDIDCDGTSDQISALVKGSGFLALDKNGDGKINDGNELFGAKSGNGFADLAAYDKDGNGWIDESDDIFDKLRIWIKDDSGEDKLVALGEKGIGAIYLGNIDSAFSLKSDSNGLNGEIRSTGIFLREDYTGGTVQHVDFAI